MLVVTPNYDSDIIQNEAGVIRIPYKLRRLDFCLERLGIYTDYLERWVNAAEKYLIDKIYQDDIIFAVSGGELGCIMLAARLKHHAGCKMIVNFHDPITATTINGKKSTVRIHVNRDKALHEYLKYADSIITCSITHKTVLEKKYHSIPCIHNVYRGYRNQQEISVSHVLHKPLHLIYGGTMSPIQSAERFIELFKGVEYVTIIYVGKASETIKKLAAQTKNVKLISSMPHDQYIKFMKEEADIGLVALRGVEFGACVPSKIFDLINLEIPILAILPDGDAKNLINNGYGVAYSGNNKEEFNFLFTTLLGQYKTIKSNMHRDKSLWQMDVLFEDIYTIIEETEVKKR